LRKWLQ